MNSILLKLFMLISGLAQLLPGVQMPGGVVPPSADAGAPSMKVRVVAFQALNTGEKKIDPELKPINKLLKELPYDTFRFVNDVEQEVTAMIEANLVVNAIYTFHATMLGTDEEGATQVATRIAMFDGTSQINALNAQGTVAPGKWLVFRGLPINQGEMVMMMTLVQEPGEEPSDSENQEDGEDQQQSENQEKKDAESGEEKEDENKEGEQAQEEQEDEEKEGEAKEGEDSSETGEQEGEQEGEESQQQAQQQSQSEEAKEGSPLDKPEIEALLDSLEDTDKREQLQQRKQKGRPFFDSSGEWW